MRFPVKKIIEHPKPIELEKITPVNIEKPFNYIEKVNVPVDGNGSESTSNHNNNHKLIDDGLQELSAGYTTNAAHKKV